jgi:poly(3-hydroxybutyrate) depolymerase
LAQRKYRLFTPDGVNRKHPARLLVLLHGCGQDSASFAASTHAATIARAQGCMVLLPEQSSQANAQRCWNWFRADARVATEAMLLTAIVEHVCSRHCVQRDAVYLLGMSAGGVMALTMALRYPERFAAVMSHSGAVPRSAANAVQATQAMQGHRVPDTVALKSALAGRRLPPLLLLHGDDDRTVVPDNALASASLWLELRPAVASTMPTPGRARLVQRGTRKACSINDWKCAGRLYVRLIRVAGLGHAWSGGAAHQAFSDPAGPDALKLALRFFDDCAEQHFAATGAAG